MSTDTTSVSSDTSSPVGASARRIRQSKSLQGVLLGLILIGIGVILWNGAVAGLLGIFGITAIVVSVTARVALLVLRRRA